MNLSQASIRGLVQSISGANFRIKLVSLILISLFFGSSYATSSCSAGATTTCTCANGKLETYPSNSDRLAEAIKDPKSCCYYKPSPTTGSMAAFNPAYSFGVKPQKQEEAVVEIQATKVVTAPIVSVEEPKTYTIKAQSPKAPQAPQTHGTYRASFLSLLFRNLGLLIYQSAIEPIGISKAP
jgi:hypothetical protein